MRPDPEVEDYIDQFDPPLKNMLNRLRALVYEIVPEATEAVKWSMPHFSLHKTVCYIAGFKNHVTFGFHDGTMLRDPDNLLLGTGKKLKYLKFKSIDEFDEERLRAWIMEGFYT